MNRTHGAILLLMTVLTLFSGSTLLALASSFAEHSNTSADVFPVDPDAVSGQSIAGADALVYWSTFLGGMKDDSIGEAIVDANGNMFLTGSSQESWGSPIRAFTPSFDAYRRTDATVAKLDSDGNLLWNTFLGGGSSDYASAIAMDDAGNIFVAGDSVATWGSPLRQYNSGAGSCDGFIAKLDPQGNLLWNTFLGGSRNDFIGHIVLDSTDSLLVSGYSRTAWTCQDTDCTVRPFIGGPDAGSDGFVAKFDTEGNLIWNTFVGGEDPWETTRAIAVTDSDEILVAGEGNIAWSCSPRPCTRRAFTSAPDICVAKLLPTGELVWNTYLGGTWLDYVFDIAIGSDDQAIVVGNSTYSWGCENSSCTTRQHSGEEDAFVAAVGSDGYLLWNSFLGSEGDDFAFAVAADRQDHLFVAGYSDGKWGMPDLPYTGADDAFAAMLDETGELIWHAFLGSAGADAARGITPAANGAVVVAGSSKASWGTPLRPYTGGSDGFVVKIHPFLEEQRAWFPIAALR